MSGDLYSIWRRERCPVDGGIVAESLIAYVRADSLDEAIRSAEESGLLAQLMPEEELVARDDGGPVCADG